MSRVEHIDWLETFVAVVDGGGFTVASEMVHRSQSRVSAHVAALERALGAYLFDRRHRPVVLTDAGEAFLPHARAILAHLGRGHSDVDAVLGLTRGHVVLGSYPSASAAFVPGLIDAFERRYPGVQLDLVEQRTLDLGDSLIAGNVHLSLRPRVPGPRADGLCSQSLWREDLVAVVPCGHPLATFQEPLSLAAIAEYPLVTIGRRSLDAPVLYETQHAFLVAGLHPDIAWQTDQPQTLMNFVRAGLGVGVTNKLAAEISETSSLTVARLAAHGREVAVFWDDRRHQSVAAQALLREIVAASPPSGTEPVTSGQGTRHT